MPIGIISAFISALFSSSKDLVSKKLSFNVDGSVSAFASFLFALPYYALLLGIYGVFGDAGIDMRSEVLILVLLRALTDTIAELSKMYAFEHADISLVVCVLALHPLLLLVVSPLVTGDPLAMKDMWAIGCIVVGSLVLAYKPSSSGLYRQRKGVCIAFLAAIFFALNTCLDRLAVQQASPLFSGFAMTALSALFLLPLMFRRGRVEALRSSTKPFLVRGVFEVGFMLCKLTALQYLYAPVVVCIQKSALLLSIVGGRVVFKEEEFFRRLCAGALVLVGVIIATVF